MKPRTVLRAVLLAGILSGVSAKLPAQDVVVRSNHNVVLKSEADTVAILRKGKAAGFKPSVLIGRVVTFRLTLGQMNAFADSMRKWPEIARDREGRLMVEWDAEFRLPPDTTQILGGAPMEVAPEWHVQAVHADQAWALGYTGQGVLTAALDGAGGFSNPNIAPNIAGGWNATQSPGIDTSQGYQVDVTCNSHGVHTFSSMSATRESRVGVAPGSRGYQIRVFQLDPAYGCTAFNSDAIRGANYAADRGARLLNVSIGFGSYSYSGMAAAAALKARGVMFCGAAGNSGATPPYWPASDSNAVGSAAIDGSGNRAGWSNYGAEVDFGSPGVGVLGAMEGTGLGYKSGTSMASPVTCGAFAVLMSAYPTATLDQLVAAMKATADSLPGARPNDYTGWGRPNVASAIAYLAPNRVKTEWLSKTYPSGPASDSVMVACAKLCRVTLPNGATIWQPTGWVHFTASSNSTITVQDVAGIPAPPPAGAMVTITPTTRYQTIHGWEATAQAGQGTAGWTGAVLDSAVALGINRLRLEIKSGAEGAPGTYNPVNDNADPNVANLAAFDFTALDAVVDAVVNPLRAKSAARGEPLWVTLNYVSFRNSSPNFHATSGAEYAELMLVTFQHLQAKYGWVPDAVEVILEPDNGTSWTGTMVGNAIAASGARLAAAGFHPDFIAPSTMSMANTTAYTDAIVAVPGALQYLKEMSYHRYAGSGEWNLGQIRDRAAALGLRTAMLEHIGSGVDDLLTDLTTGNGSAWQQYTLAFPTADDGAQYFTFAGNVPVAGSRTRQLREVFQNVRRGAVRVGSVSTDATQSVASFLNPDGRLVALVRVRSAGPVNLSGLPAGSYAVSFTSDAGVTTASTASVSSLYSTALPAAGVLSLRGTP